jgi:glyoxylase-like metal-dependent hydrolase (beta-lactamase superfamily II)/ferredoxin
VTPAAPGPARGYLCSVARRSSAVRENAPGDLFVDDTCIACDTCRRLAPSTYGGAEDDRSFVQRQPRAPRERRQALLALVACPVAAIGVSEKTGVVEAASAFPVEITQGVFDCGYAAESSFGAASWLVVRPAGNVLVDSPRFARPLAERIHALGGARYQFLTHRDDVADHARWSQELGCERILHARDVTYATRAVERQVEGDAPVAIANDLLVVPVPGHTAGSSALLVKERFLFTGDHLWGDARGRLGASRSVCWYDWGQQTRSMERLLGLRFEWILPGHGRPWHAALPEAVRGELEALIDRMRSS